MIAERILLLFASRIIIIILCVCVYLQIIFQVMCWKAARVVQIMVEPCMKIIHRYIQAGAIFIPAALYIEVVFLVNVVTL